MCTIHPRSYKRMKAGNDESEPSDTVCISKDWMKMKMMCDKSEKLNTPIGRALVGLIDSLALLYLDLSKYNRAGL